MNERCLVESLELTDVVVPSYSLALDDKVVGTFFQVFTFNSTVTSLRLLKSTKVTNRLSHALSEKISLSSFCSLLKEQIQTLRVNTSLSSLNLCSASISDEGANSLAQALRVTTSLSSLNVRSNFIGDEEANLLAQTLRVNNSLSYLDLSDNSISVEGANLLAQALGVNTSLSSLDLDCNSIGDERANSFAQTLRVNTSLGFQFDWCWGSQLSCSSLQGKHHSLPSLNLGSNSIGDEGANSIAQALTVNISLSSLDLGSHSLVMKEQIQLLRPSE